MANPNVIQLPKTVKPARKPRCASKAAMVRRHAPAAGLGTVILVLLYLSLNHLAGGIAVVTLCAEWEGMAMAVGLDLLIVALEVAMVTPRRALDFHGFDHARRPSVSTSV
jgi:hypothetical protein